MKFELLRGLQLEKFVNGSGAVPSNPAYDIVRMSCAPSTDYVIDKLYFRASFFNGTTYLSDVAPENTTNKFKTPENCNNVIITFTMDTGSATKYKELFIYPDIAQSEARISTVEKKTDRLMDERLSASPLTETLSEQVHFIQINMFITVKTD